MTKHDPIVAAPSARDPVEELAEDFLERYRRGERPALTEFIDRAPEHADEIRDLFPALVLMEQAGPAAAPAPTPHAAPAAPLERLGDYRIICEIGRGGMGIVYEADQEALDRRVALKVLPSPAAADSHALLRFRREARSAARLHHTNIVPVFDIGERDGVHYYAMQFIQGQGLDEVIKELHGLRPGRGQRQRAGPLPLSAAGSLAGSLLTSGFDPAEATRIYASDTTSRSDPKGQAGATSVLSEHSDFSTKSDFHFYRSVARIGLQVADALAYAHGQRVLHRDIKPSNLLLDAQGTVWVTDFGLAKEAGDDLTRTGDIVGTLRYMAPERFNGISDSRSDVYSLGLTLYELLTLQPAFPETDRLRLVQAITRREPAAPRKLDPHVPRDLETIVLKAITKEPAGRYTSAAEMEEDLRRFLADRPIRARRASAWEQTRRWCRRNPALAGLVAVLVVGATVATWQAIVATRAQRDAVAAAAAERAAKETALKREAEKQAVLDFVESHIFAAARPRRLAGGMGRDTSLREAMEAALPHVEGSFSDQPLIEARLRMTLGLSFTYLGDDKAAEAQFLRARQLYTSKLGPYDPDTLSSAHNLTLAYSSQGRHEEALKLNEQTLALRRAHLPPNHPDTLKSMANVASNYFALHRHEEALKLREETLELARAQFGRQHRSTVQDMNNLANSYQAVGRLTAALELYEQALALYRAKDPEHPDVLTTEVNLAKCLGGLGRHQEALAHNEETLRLMTKQLGEDHPSTLLTMSNLSTSYASLGRFAEALELGQRTFQLLKDQRGPDHPHTLGCMANVAYFLIDLDRDDDALPLIDECVKRATGRAVDPSLFSECLIRRLRIFEKRRDAAGCRTTTETWEKLNRTDAQGLLIAAHMRCVVAKLVKQDSTTPEAPRLAKEEADRAMEWLRKAVAAGFRQGEPLKKHTDFDALRDREDFVQLLAELAAGEMKDKK